MSTISDEARQQLHDDKLRTEAHKLLLDIEHDVSQREHWAENRQHWKESERHWRYMRYYWIVIAVVAMFAVYSKWPG